MIDINPSETLARLRSFYRKERGILLANATTGTGDLPPCTNFLKTVGESLEKNAGTLDNELVRESSEFWQRADPQNILMAMDYHLDWLATALYSQGGFGSEQDNFPSELHEKREIPVIRGNQEDADLMLAGVDAGGTLQILLIEAKFDGGWTWKQLSSKLLRLAEILKPISSEHLNVQLILAQPVKINSRPKWDPENDPIHITWTRSDFEYEALREKSKCDFGAINFLAAWEFPEDLASKIKAPAVPLYAGSHPIFVPSRTEKSGERYEKILFKKLSFRPHQKGRDQGGDDE